METTAARRFGLLKRILTPILVISLAYIVLTYGRSISRAKPKQPPSTQGVVLYDASLSRL